MIKFLLPALHLDVDVASGNLLPRGWNGFKWCKWYPHLLIVNFFLGGHCPLDKYNRRIAKLTHFMRKKEEERIHRIDFLHVARRWTFVVLGFEYAIHGRKYTKCIVHCSVLTCRVGVLMVVDTADIAQYPEIFQIHFHVWNKSSHKS